MQKVYKLARILVKWLVKWTKEKDRDLNIFDKNQVFDKNSRVTRNFLGQGIYLGLKIHQIFYLLNKKIQIIIIIIIIIILLIKIIIIIIIKIKQN